MSAMLWLLAASVLGFALTWIFSSLLQWRRSLFLVPYIAGIAAFLAIFADREGITVAELTRSWVAGVVGGSLAGLLLLWNILSQPRSPRSSGGTLALALAWSGVAYGLVDALFLNVMPVLAVARGALLGSDAPLATQFTAGLGALLASLAVTVAYHLGYAEFRGRSLIGAVIGNAIITASYLLSGSPVAAILAHIAMHVAALLRGPETMLQLPPHYVVSAGR